MVECRHCFTILDLEMKVSGLVSLTSRPLYLERNTRYPLNRRLGGLQSRSGRCGVEKHNFLLDAQPVARRYTD
jgi:hypothetical protein